MDENEHKCYANIAYAGVSMTKLRPPEPQEYETPVVVPQNNIPIVKDTMYDAVIPSQKSTESGQDYDKLDRGKENGNICQRDD